jgi:hypothetical protein
MKAEPIADGALGSIPDAADLTRRTEEVSKMWREAGVRMPTPEPHQMEGLAWHIAAYAAQPTDDEKERLDTLARSAIKTLLTWCNYDPNDNGLPHLIVKDQRLLDLEAALNAALPLATATPSRAWVNPAWSVWSRVASIATTLGEKAGVSVTSHAVRFTSLALKSVGHPAATPGAISMELRNDEEFRKRMSS